MINCFRTLIAASLATFVCAATSHAIEPDAPEALVTRDEAIVVAARQRIDQLPSTKNTGDNADRAALATFYAGHAGPPLWIDKQGLNAQARKIAEEIRKAAVWGLDPEEFDLPAASASGNGALIDSELRMSLAILKYARHARGGRMDPKELSLDIDRAPPLEDPHVVLNTLKTSGAPDAYLRDLHPKHDQFEKLRVAYLAALEREKHGLTIEPAPAIDELEGKKKKKRKAKRKKRRKSTTKLSKRLLYNMEMWRWMPRDLGEKYVQANVPEYKVRVVKNHRIIHEERIVTGKVQNKTPIFSDQMETVVFHPFWGVPNSIKVKEILPSLVRGGNVLEKQNLKISYGGRPVDPASVDWTRTDIRNFHVYQPPGSRNALGIVKFLFPNKHAVYMHDTPSKHLFKRKQRAYSHGCMRVRNPLKLAEVVLSADRGWNRSKIDSLVRAGPKNNQIALNKAVPVHVTYFTVHINEAGKPVLFKDIYGHEKRIQMGLDGKAHLIVKRKTNLDLARRKVVSNVSSSSTSFFSSSSSGDRSWTRAVFGNN